MRNKIKLNGFTIAEVLLVIAVAGIVSALTIPSLISVHNKKILSSQLKKVCTQINLAAQQVIADEAANQDDFTIENPDDTEESGGVTTGFYATTAGMVTSSSTSGAKYFLDNYFKTITKNCAGSCTATTYKATDGTNLGGVGDYYCVMTTNGAAICMKHTTDMQNLIIDINGPKIPNITGQDVFSMIINAKGEFADYTDDETKCNTSQVTAPNKLATYATGCLTKVINNGWQIK